MKHFLSGGLVAGPVGLAIGGTVGGVTAWKMTEGMISTWNRVVVSPISHNFVF